MPRPGSIRLSLALTLAVASAALAQDKGTLDPKPLPPLGTVKETKIPARELFGRKLLPTHATPRAIGFYAHGCLAGGEALPINGPTWQVMRLSRNRNWGHPNLVRFVKRLSENGAKAGWPGLLVGDMSQPRGGPMFTGHTSHQVGLDVDIWLRPMPDRELTRAEREEISSTNVVAADRKDVDPAIWTPAHLGLIKAAAEAPEVERIFVNAAIKKALCRDAGSSRAWLAKVRPYYGHDYHFHVRIACPSDSQQCEKQPPAPHEEGCGKELNSWFTDAILHPKPPPVPTAPTPPKRQLTLAQLPAACRQVVAEP